VRHFDPAYVSSGSKREAAFFGLMSASASCGHRPQGRLVQSARLRRGRAPAAASRKELVGSVPGGDASSSADEVKKAVEPYGAHQDEINRDNIVQQLRPEQNEDAATESNERDQIMGEGGQPHGGGLLGFFPGWTVVPFGAFVGSRGAPHNDAGDGRRQRLTPG